MKPRMQLPVCVVLLLSIAPSVMGFRPRKASYSPQCSQRLQAEDTLQRIYHYTTTRPTALQAAMRFKNFEQMLDTFHEEAVVIYFSTSKCGPCQLMKKEIATIKETIGDELKMFSVDTEKWPHVGSRFEVARLPCLVVFREGEIKLRLEGVNTAEAVVEQVRTFL